MEKLLIAFGYILAASLTMVALRRVSGAGPPADRDPADESVATEVNLSMRYQVSFRWSRHAVHDVVIALTYLAAYLITKSF